MSRTQRDMNCSADDVYAILQDGWLYALWVVGASRVRDVDESWPQPGAEIHHSIGAWPLLLNDTTSVTDCRPGRSISLRARARLAGEAQVVIELEALADDRCRVTITEDAAKGPGRLIPAVIRNPLLHQRNVEALRRLSYVAEGRRPPV